MQSSLYFSNDNAVASSNKMLKVAFVVLLLSSCNVFACFKTLKVGTNENNWPPYVIAVNGNLTGVEIDVLNTIFNGSSFCLKFMLLPTSSRAFEELKEGRIDVIFAASKTLARADFAYFSDAYRDEVVRLYKYTESPDLNNISDIFYKDLTLAVNRGSYYGVAFELFKQNHPANVIMMPTAEKRFAMLNKNRVDYAIEDELAAQYFINQYPAIEAVTNMAAINKSSIHLMLSKKTISQIELQAINELIKQNKSAIQAIYPHY
ncbi:transporter substrate-binding domain-containing protein [Pseudoalteromonas sp. APC 3356]|uniref:substrate-binding periplasmic protein n=1 Tax=unclassified Pseudoalteromonas TaxID=194690 RepID=UPI00037A2A53|nr:MULTISPECIES: transporter substrate-binding domain-containing protein [unclassified Pseudoalteromonas]MDN3434881.1 transporter substrate-binding domain-containing protein [Pseudoalteromonas sp. APC 3356]